MTETQDLQNMTLGQIFKSISRLRYSTLATIIAIFIAVVSASFAIGRYTYQKDTAVKLETPFAMRIIIDDKHHDFNSLTLIRDPSLPTVSEDKISLSLREIRSSFDIVQVGVVVATVEKSELGNVWSIFSMNIVSSITGTAYAAPTNFNWYGHEKDMDFTEKFVNPETVNRKYGDGCILEYKVDGSRRSVPSSFRWIKVNH